MLLCAQQAVPRFRDHGSITFTSGTAAVRPPPGMGHLVGVAGTLISTTYGLAQDLAPKVRVNTIAPGLVDSEFWDVSEHMSGQILHCITYSLCTQGMPAAQRDAIFDHLKTKIPLCKAGTTDEIAESVSSFANYLFAY
jgi:NAD(P)-dependent dehydrogenase (short-subunit alcohol dehydrogenase family)